MKKTLIISGALAAILSSTSFTTNLYAGSNNSSFSVSVYLPPAITNVAHESQIAITEQTITHGYKLDLFTEEKIIMGEKLLVKTSVLR